MRCVQLPRTFRLWKLFQTPRGPQLPSDAATFPPARREAIGKFSNAPCTSDVRGGLLAGSAPSSCSRVWLAGAEWCLRGLGGPYLAAIRRASGGAGKGGESAKEKKLRRLLKKLNSDASQKRSPGGREPHEEDTADRQQRRSGADRERVLADCESVAAAAEQQMRRQLMHLEGKLKELQVARPQPEVFERISVHIAGGRRQLSDLGQVVIRGSSLVRLTLFNEQHLSKVISALRNTDERWAIVEDGPNTIRVQLPRMNEELRASFVTKAKAATEECKVQIRRARQESRAKMHSAWEKTKSIEESVKREKEQELQKRTDEAIKRASSLLSDKLNQLTAPAS